LKSELKEKNDLVIELTDRNKMLMVAAGEDRYKEVVRITAERDKYKVQCNEMEKFLSDYGLKWVGGEGGQR
jgi:hypothetical protein